MGFTGSAKSLKVKKTGSFSYGFTATPLGSGKATFTSTKKVKVGSKRRKIIKSKTFTVPAGGTVKVTLKLSKSQLKALKTAKKLKFSVAVALGGKTFTTSLTLKKPTK